MSLLGATNEKNLPKLSVLFKFLCYGTSKVGAMFASIAPKYWSSGLPVIPVRGKRPVVQSWQQLAERMPTDDEQAYMLARFGDLNVGLPLGPQSGIVVIDIDNVDPEHVATIEQAFPSSYRRVGKKGCVLAFRFNGERNFQIRDSKNDVLVEVLSTKKQVVLPPSIHPDTGQPYRANAELLDVVGQLPGLPLDVEARLTTLLVGLGYQLGASGRGSANANSLAAPVVNVATGLIEDGRNDVAWNIRRQFFTDYLDDHDQPPTEEVFTVETFKIFAARCVTDGRYSWEGWQSECRGEYRRLTSRYKKGLDPTTPPAFPVRDRLSVAEGEQALTKLVHQFVNSKRDMLIRVTAGGGKTATTIKVLASRLGNRIIHFYAPTHRNCDEVRAKFEALGVDAVVVAGRDKAGCTHQDAVRAAVSAGLPVRQVCCAECPDKQGCKYLDQFKQTAQVWIFPHAYLSLPMDKGVPAADLIVVDENCLGELAEVDDNTIKTKDLTGPLSGKLLSWLHDPIGDLRERIGKAELRAVLKVRRDMETERIKFALGTRSKTTSPDKMIPVLEALLIEYDSGQPIRSVRLHEDRVILCRWKAGHRLNKPTLFLDATAEEDLLKIRWPDLEVHRLDLKMNVVVSQQFSTSISKKAMHAKAGGCNLIAKIQRIIDKRAKVHSFGLIVTHKDCEEFFRVPDGWQINHFGNLRGTNSYEDATCVVVIGQQSVWDYVVHDLAAALCHGLPVECSREASQFVARGYSSGGGVQVRGFSDPVLAAFARLITEAEVEQDIHRIRPVRATEPKEVVLVSRHPIDLEVDHLMTLNDLAEWSDIEKLWDNWVPQALPLGIDWLSDKFGWSVDKAKRAKRHLGKGVQISIKNTIWKSAPLISYRTEGQRGTPTTAMVRPGNGIGTIGTVLKSLHGRPVSLTDEAKDMLRYEYLRTVANDTDIHEQAMELDATVIVGRSVVGDFK